MANINLYLHIPLLLLTFTFINPSTTSPTSPFTPDFSNDSSSARFLGQCSQGSYYMDGTCSKVCPGKFFGYNNQCLSCPKSCENRLCLSQSVCNPCTGDNEIYFYGSQSCVAQCPAGFFEDFHNKICVECSKGCTTCTYPNGSCASDGINTSLIIYISVPIGVLIIAVIAICLWRKSRKPTATTKKSKKKSKRAQQAQQDIEIPSPSRKNKLAQLKKFGDNNTPVGPYNVMPEDFNQVDETEEDEGAASPGARSKKKRLTNPKLLTPSLSKNFKVDDSNDESAITHGSAALRPRSGSLNSLNKGGESPSVRPRKPIKRASAPKLLRQETQGDKMLDFYVDESVTGHTSFNEMASPAAGLTPKRETPRGFTMVLKKMENGEKELGEDMETVQTEENVEKIEEAEEGEEEDFERKDKEGYREDSSMNESRDGGMPDHAACTICGMNKRDCVNKPCGHVVGCLACMKQFRESYGMCPKCKVPLKKLEKMEKIGGELKLRKSQFSHKEEKEAVQV